MKTCVNVCGLQLDELVNISLKLKKIFGYLETAGQQDFIAVGAEIPFFDSLVHEPCQPLRSLAQATGSHTVARINPDMGLPGGSAGRDGASIYVFDRLGDVAVSHGWVNLTVPGPTVLGRTRGHALEPFETEGIRIGLVRCSDFLRGWVMDGLRETDIIFFANTVHNGLAMDMAKKLATRNTSHVVMVCCNGFHSYQNYYCSGAAIVTPALTAGGRVEARIVEQVMPEGYVRASLDIEYIRQLKALRKLSGSRPADGLVHGVRGHITTQTQGEQ